MLKEWYTGHLEVPLHLFPCCIETESPSREVGCACCKTPDQLFQRQQSAFESVSAAPDERATYVFKSDCATRQRHLFFRRVGYERRLTVSFDDGFRVSTPKITSRSAVHRPLWCVHIRRHRSGHTDTVRSGPSQIWSNPIRA